MKKTILKAIFLVVTVIWIMCIPVTPTYAAKQGTAEDELQAMEAEQLELQLGVEWADVEFRSKTDAGLYPNTVAVGKDGVLRLEIGGSSKYILSCANSAVPVPEPDGAPLSSETTQAPATTESSESQSEEIKERDPKSTGSAFGIPVAPLALFAVGMILSVCALILLCRTKKNRKTVQGDDE